MRQKAWQVLLTHVSKENDVLLKHSLAVEAAMRAYAEKFEQDEEYWGAVGLLHDVDFEKYPHEHPHHAREILHTHGYDDHLITDVESHSRSWPKERTLLQKTLLAVDELTGFIIACAMVRPDKSLDNLEVSSVMKKMKDKSFAKAVNRSAILQSAEDMNTDLKEHIAFVTKALAKTIKEQPYDKLTLS